MRSLLKVSAICFFLTLSANCAHHSPDRNVAQAAGELPDNEAWVALKNFASHLNLTEPGTELSLSTGGTSVYAVVNRGGRPIGAVIPENGASSLSGEVISYNLARAFGVSDIYQEGVYFFITGQNFEVFRDLVPKTPYREARFKNKEENRVALVNRMAKNPGGIDAIYKAWGSKPQDYDGLVKIRGTTMDASHILEGSSRPFAGFLKCAGPHPSAAVTVTLGEGTTTELEAARQLSSILLIDALTQQWDRFSGGNLQFVSKKGSSKFVAYDNGGTWGGSSWTQKSLAMVSRFDRGVANEILEMHRFLSKGSGNYKGYTTEAELITALGIDHFPRNFAKFKDALATVANHIRKNEGCFFQ